jgi:hypothetical protein
MVFSEILTHVKIIITQTSSINYFHNQIRQSISSLNKQQPVMTPLREDSARCISLLK